MKKVFILVFLWWCVCGCGGGRHDVKEAGTYPVVFPDYQFVTIPVNMAPLNFKVPGADRIEVEFSQGGNLLYTYRGKGGMDVPVKTWHELLGKVKDNDLAVKVFARKNGLWIGYNPFSIRVSADSIDAYLAYRLIEPGYELGAKLSLFQRELSSFKEEPFVYHGLMDNGCVNCHAFCNYSPDLFMFHVRQQNAGTIIVDHGDIKKVNTKTAGTITPGAYRMWHPSGKYIAFSNNQTHQGFHAFQEKKLEVYDLESDLMVYDVKDNKVLTDERFLTKDEWETYPAWSPDGKFLYFCRALGKKMPDEYKDLKYGIYRVAFREADGTLGEVIDTLVNPAVNNKSASYPSVSPDGRYLLYTLAESATFPIHHKEADLEMIDLETGLPVDVGTLNSPCAESYHAWSSSGRWIMFSSRRMDGSYTHVYFAHMDKDGTFGKPFVLPQQDPDFYDMCLKSFNVPEFIKARITVSPYRLEKAVKGTALNAR